MSTTRKLAAGGAVPAIAVPKVGGGEIAIGNSGGWQMVVVYRGKHCPICRTYLKGLDALNGLKFIRERGYPIRGTAA